MSRLLRALGFTAAAVGIAAVLVLLLLPRGPREPMDFDDPWHQPRETVRAREWIVVAGSPFATETMTRVLASGGNAVDAAVAGLLTLNVTFGDAASFPGIAPVLVWDAERRRVRGYVGAGVAPRRATIEEFHRRGHEVVPRMSILAQLVPASPDVIVALLTEHGTRSFGELAADAIRLAEEGFPTLRITAKNLDLPLWRRIGYSILMPYNAKVFLRGEWWRPVHWKDRLVRPDLARTLRGMGQVESHCRGVGGSREDCLAAVRAHFYVGPIAEAIVAFHAAEDGLFSAEDLAGYRGGWEAPLRGRFQGFDVATTGPWTQGIVVPMALQILEPLPLRELGHNSAAYVHTVAQAIELAMADRDAYVGDPAFVDVPVAELLSPAFAARRRAAMTDRAFGETPPPGALRTRAGDRRPPAVLANASRTGPAPAPAAHDTSYIAVIDAAGNSVSMTPSDFPITPMVPGWGLTLGNRMTQFRLDPASPTSLAPGKRPRVTPHAVMLLRDGEHVASLGTPGGEMQTQALVQVLLNHLVFGMDLQEAIDAPRFRSRNWPDSFSPHEYLPGTIELEAPLHDAVAAGLEERGYTVRRFPEWDNHFGGVGFVRHEDGGGLAAGADPRESTLAAGR